MKLRTAWIVVPALALCSSCSWMHRNKTSSGPGREGWAASRPQTKTAPIGPPAPAPAKH